MEKLLVRLLLRALCGPAEVTGSSLYYSRVARGFAVVFLLLLAGLALLLTLQRKPLPAGEVRVLIAIVVAFAVLGAVMAIEVFLVKHEYDGTGISYRSPWSAPRRVAWAEVTRIEWRSTLKWLDFVPADASRRLHLHPMLGGLAPFAKLALQQIPSSAWADQPEAYIALRLMAAGHHVELTVDARKPSQLAADPGLRLSV